MPKIPETLTLDKILEALEDDAYLGFCLACAAQHDGVEPDARRYVCEECGMPAASTAPKKSYS